MKNEGRIEKKKKRASRRQRNGYGDLIETEDLDVIKIDGFKRPKLTHETLLSTPKNIEMSSFDNATLQIIPGSPELVHQ
jgi:hypothetical protein